MSRRRAEAKSFFLEKRLAIQRNYGPSLQGETAENHTGCAPAVPVQGEKVLCRALPDEVCAAMTKRRCKNAHRKHYPARLKEKEKKTG